ncbi:ABC transporter ATP-binding protein [Pseudooceanicola sp.]|uniref:ABC transporter ATP-binding protein n=1 Tax=Pseudooceanicola sp. TaxID=1914328 RepID=UPI002634A347|nr:ABC transporter ATP-binding protein [Pseudooceanicola sp.]MDF1855882.1 ABC transporter ATP-binding protein [Pseudooceanicola sp.]
MKPVSYRDPSLTDNAAQPLLSVSDLSVYFRAGRKSSNRVVDNVTFDVARGETVGLVGESGSGKTVTGLSLLGLLPEGIAWTEGQIGFDGKDIGKMSESEMRRLRGRHISMIFQEPMTALDPVFTIGEQLTETLRTHFPMSKREARERAITALEDVGIPLPHKRVEEYPHHLSGGMRQRAMIAIALACEPDLLIADEPTTALDVTIQAQIIDLIMKIVSDRNTALIFISHNLGVVSQVCDRMITMYAGQVVEDSVTDEVLEQPLHPYSSGLLASVPRKSVSSSRLPSIPGRVPSPDAMPPGCRFEPRCTFAQAGCEAAQVLHRRADGRVVRCHRHDQLTLKGALT